MILHKKFEVKQVDVQDPWPHKVKRWVLTELQSVGSTDEIGDVFVQGMPPAIIMPLGTTFEGTLTIPDQEPANV